MNNRSSYTWSHFMGVHGNIRLRVWLRNLENWELFLGDFVWWLILVHVLKLWANFNRCHIISGKVVGRNIFVLEEERQYFCRCEFMFGNWYVVLRESLSRFTSKHIFVLGVRRCVFQLPNEHLNYCMYLHPRFDQNSCAMIWDLRLRIYDLCLSVCYSL